MVGGGQPQFAPLLYKELIKRPEYQTSEQRQALNAADSRDSPQAGIYRGCL